MADETELHLRGYNETVDAIASAERGISDFYSKQRLMLTQHGQYWQKLIDTLNQATVASNRSSRQSREELGYLGKQLEEVQRKLVGALSFAAVEEFTRRSVSAFSNLDRAMRLTQGITHETAAQLDQVRDRLNQLERETGQTMTVLETNRRKYESQILALGDDAKKLYDPIVLASKALGTDISNMATASVAAMNSLKIPPKEFGEALREVAHILPGIADGFGSAVGKIGHELEARNIAGKKSFEEIAAVEKILAPKFASGHEAMNQFTSTFQQLVSNPQMQAGLKQIAANQGDMTDVLKLADQVVGNITNNFTQMDQLRKLGFGTDDIIVVKQLHEHLSEINKIVDEAATNHEALAEQVKKTDSEYAHGVDELTGAYHRLELQIGKVAAAAARPILEKFTKEMDKLTDVLQGKRSAADILRVPAATPGPGSPQRHQAGGIINQPAMGMVGESGPEAVIPMADLQKARERDQAEQQRSANEQQQKDQQEAATSSRIHKLIMQAKAGKPFHDWDDLRRRSDDTSGGGDDGSGGGGGGSSGGGGASGSWGGGGGGGRRGRGGGPGGTSDGTSDGTSGTSSTPDPDTTFYGPDTPGTPGADTGGGATYGPQDRSNKSIPASVRYNNPGAQWPSAESKRFGMTDVGIIGGGNQIAGFPTPVHGLASNIGLLQHPLSSNGQKGYVGLSVSAAVSRWTAGGQHSVPGYENATLTAELAKDPTFLHAFFMNRAKVEAGKPGTLTETQINQAIEMFQSGSAAAYEAKHPDFVAAYKGKGGTGGTGTRANPLFTMVNPNTGGPIDMGVLQQAAQIAAMGNNKATRGQAVEEVKKYITGQGLTYSTGEDCAEFVTAVLAKSEHLPPGVLPAGVKSDYPSAASYLHYGTEVDAAHAQPGDVLALRGGGHAMIVGPNGYDPKTGTLDILSANNDRRVTAHVDPRTGKITDGYYRDFRIGHLDMPKKEGSGGWSPGTGQFEGFVLNDPTSVGASSASETPSSAAASPAQQTEADILRGSRYDDGNLDKPTAAIARSAISPPRGRGSPAARTAAAAKLATPASAPSQPASQAASDAAADPSKAAPAAEAAGPPLSLKSTPSHPHGRRRMQDGGLVLGSPMGETMPEAGRPTQTSDAVSNYLNRTQVLSNPITDVRDELKATVGDPREAGLIGGLTALGGLPMAVKTAVVHTTLGRLYSAVTGMPRGAANRATDISGATSPGKLPTGPATTVLGRVKAGRELYKSGKSAIDIATGSSPEEEAGARAGDMNPMTDLRELYQEAVKHSGSPFDLGKAAPAHDDVRAQLAKPIRPEIEAPRPPSRARMLAANRRSARQQDHWTSNAETRHHRYQASADTGAF